MKSSPWTGFFFFFERFPLNCFIATKYESMLAQALRATSSTGLRLFCKVCLKVVVDDMISSWKFWLNTHHMPKSYKFEASVGILDILLIFHHESCIVGWSCTSDCVIHEHEYQFIYSTHLWFCWYSVLFFWFSIRAHTLLRLINIVTIIIIFVAYIWLCIQIDTHRYLFCTPHAGEN